MPEDFPEAKSIIIVAKATPIAYIDFEYKGKTHTITIPPQYFDDGTKVEEIIEYLRNELFKNKDTSKKYEIKVAKQIFLKSLAVRSGLAKYGRNNISYVGEMGSFHYLFAFFTNYVPEHYDWTDRKLMDTCENCKICERMCPTSALRDGRFLVDVDKCITLYNEVDGGFPDIFPQNDHNSLMGCIRCQYSCPGNAISKKNSVKLESIDEEETNMILRGEMNDKLIRSISTKLKMFKYEQHKEMLPIIRRNLKVLLNEKE